MTWLVKNCQSILAQNLSTVLKQVETFLQSTSYQKYSSLQVPNVKKQLLLEGITSGLNNFDNDNDEPEGKQSKEDKASSGSHLTTDKYLVTIRKRK